MSASSNEKLRRLLLQYVGHSIKTKSMPQLVPSCSPVLATNRWTVLVVEDEPILRDLMKRMLEKRDYRVLVADSGAAALELAQAETEGIDLLVTDVMMPGLDGFEVADEITALHAHIRVLYLTGHATESPYLSDRFDGQGGALLGKPFTQAALIAQIENLLRTPVLRLV